MHKSWIYKFKIYAFDHRCWFRTTKTNKKTICWPLPLSVMIWPTNNFGYVPISPFDERILRKESRPEFRMFILYWSRLDYCTFCSVVKFFSNIWKTIKYKVNHECSKIQRIQKFHVEIFTQNKIKEPVTTPHFSTVYNLWTINYGWKLVSRTWLFEFTILQISWREHRILRSITDHPECSKGANVPKFKQKWIN